MVHAGLTALLDSKPCNKTKVLAIFDNEEVGSGTKQGAASPILRTILERVAFNQGYKIEELYQPSDHEPGTGNQNQRKPKIYN